ncbi:MAG: autoinducer binding domain-containing protein [Rhodosalinus sp.]|uniref:autoinducer binding domain-containing protein n=1 Tax=Rhodosalinus sp. TaxID=2047741 RepID=UPI0039781666
MNVLDLGQLPPNDQPFDKFLVQLCDRLGFDYAAYAGMNPIQGSIHGYVTYPDAWKKHYVARSFQNIDPTLTMAGRSIAPVDWRRLERDTRFDRVFRDAGDFGIADRGMTVPVRGPFGEIGMLSVTRDCTLQEWEMLTREVIGDLQSAAVHLHDTVMRSDVLSRTLRHPALSAREVEILQWTAAGKSQQDVGDILSISSRTVEVHLRSARSKLCALTTAQAVGRAIGLGLITPL